MDTIGRDHLDAANRADIDAVRAENAAIAVDEDIELTLQTALGFLKTNRLGVAYLCLDGGITSVETPVRKRHRRHHLAPDTRVVVTPDEAATRRRERPFGDSLGQERIRGGDELRGNACEFHLLGRG